MAAASPAEFNNAHIPGAVLMSPYLSVPARCRIIVYQYAGYPIAAALAFARLDARGFGRRTSILNGGWRAWKAAGGAATAGPPRQGSGMRAGPPARTVFVNRAFVAAHLHHPGVLIVDARLPVYYSGQQAEAPGERKGHIPGALDLPYTQLATPGGRFLTRAQIAAAFHHIGASASQLLIVYCHSGRKAAVDYFAARLLGFHVRYYAGSWLNWTGGRTPPPPANASAAAFVRDAVIGTGSRASVW